MDELVRKLDALQEVHRVNYVRVQWVDIINFVRYRVIPMEHFRCMLKSQRPGVTVVKVSVALVFLTVPEGFGCTGEYLYAIDPNSLRLCGYAPGHAVIMGWFEEKEIITSPPRSLRSPFCPRDILRKTVESIQKTYGVQFLAGWETEFILLKSTNPLDAVNDYGWSLSNALLSGTPEYIVMEEIAASLGSAGIHLEMYHAEAAPGQYEVVTGPLPPLESVDALVHTRETIKNIAAKHNMRATLTPRVYNTSTGSAAHVHLSLRTSTSSPSAGCKSVPQMTRQDASFLQSLLDHIPAVNAFTMPTEASYGRMLDGVWSGGTYVSWGKDNRETLVRVCGLPDNLNFEIRNVDGTANPYIALASILAAGMLGQGKCHLTIGDCTVMPSTLEEHQRRDLGITTRMPLSLREARLRLEADQALTFSLGQEFVKTYVNINKCLEESLKREDEESALDLLIRTY